MAVDWDKDLLAPVMGEFGEDAGVGLVNYRPNQGAPFDLADAVYDEAYLERTMSDETAPVSTSNPILGVRLALFPAGAPPIQGDKVYVPRIDTLFVVTNVEADSYGHAVLQLQIVAGQ